MISFLFVLAIPVIIFALFACLTLVVSFRERQLVQLWVPMDQVTSSPSHRNDSIEPNPHSQADLPSTLNAYAPPLSSALSSARSSARSLGQPVAPNDTAGGCEDAIPLTPYSMTQGQQLTAMGYKFLGTFQYNKGKAYKIRGDFMMSADHMIIAVVECGSMYKIAVANVSMISLGDRPFPKYRPAVRRTRLATPKWFAIDSVSNEAAADVDLSGRTQTYVFQNASVAELESWHRKRFTDVNVTPFSNQPLFDLQQFRKDRFAEAVELGRMKYIDDSENVLRPTIRGAVRTFITLYAIQLGRRIWPHQRRLSGR